MNSAGAVRGTRPPRRLDESATRSGRRSPGPDARSDRRARQDRNAFSPAPEARRAHSGNRARDVGFRPSSDLWRSLGGSAMATKCGSFPAHAPCRKGADALVALLCSGWSSGDRLPAASPTHHGESRVVIATPDASSVDLTNMARRLRRASPTVPQPSTPAAKRPASGAEARSCAPPARSDRPSRRWTQRRVQHRVRPRSHPAVKRGRSGSERVLRSAPSKVVSRGDARVRVGLVMVFGARDRRLPIHARSAQAESYSKSGRVFISRPSGALPGG